MHELTSLLTMLVDKLCGIKVPDYFVILGLIMVGTLVGAYITTRKLSIDKPGLLQQIFELFTQLIVKFLNDIIGPEGRKYIAINGAFAVLILLANLSGQIPGFMPPTGNIMVTISLALCAFVAYNYYGIRIHGFRYPKQFLGPIALMAPLFLPIELISHVARPVSLAIRLFGNIFGDHKVGGVFLHLVPFGIPVPFIMLGIFVAVVQTLVFVLLSMIYIAEAVAHE